MKAKDFFNLPNILTNIRILLVPIFIIFLLQKGVCYKSIAFIVFILASITDYYDGLIARKKQLVTTYGIFMDPLADKILMGAAFFSFTLSSRLGVDLGLSLWLIVPIVFREIGITILRSILLMRGVSMPASIWGKIKTVLQMTAVVYILLIIFSKSLLRYLYDNIFKETFYIHMEKILLAIPWYLLFVTMVVTVLTGVHYLYMLSRHFKQNTHVNE